MNESWMEGAQDHFDDLVANSDDIMRTEDITPEWVVDWFDSEDLNRLFNLIRDRMEKEDVAFEMEMKAQYYDKD